MMMLSLFTVQSSCANFKSCQLCMMTTAYIKDLVDRNLTTMEIVDEGKTLCELFSYSLKDNCQTIISRELEFFETNRAFDKTNQEFCYSIDICSKPGPAKRRTNLQYDEEFLDDIIGSMDSSIRNANRIKQEAQRKKDMIRYNDYRQENNGHNSGQKRTFLDEAQRLLQNIFDNI